MYKKNLKKALIGLSCASLSMAAMAGESPLQQGRFTMSGYGDVSYVSSNAKNGSFMGKFVPIFLFQLNDKMHVESEINFSTDADGETTTELEYADIHYFLTDSTTITAGKFLLPFGYFGPNLHPSWINPLPTMPGIYGEGGGGIMKPLMPVMSDFGASVQQTINIGGSHRIFIDAFVTNGPGEEAPVAGAPDEDSPNSFPEVAFEGKTADNNKSKAVGGRLAYAWLPRLEVGTSYYGGAYDTTGSLRFSALGADVNYTGSFYRIRGEYIKTQADKLDDTGAEVTIDRNGWYLQGELKLSVLNMPTLTPVSLVLRSSQITESAGGDRWTAGINYALSSSTAFKVAYEKTKMDEKDANGVDDDTRLFAQLAFGF